MLSFKEFLNEEFTEITVEKLIDKYIDKVKLTDKNSVKRFDIEDGFYIEFSATTKDDEGKRIVMGYRIDINSRSIKLGVGNKLYRDWKTIYSTYYNLETKEFGNSFNTVFKNY